MAYTNGIFYADYQNGSDTARATFAPTNYSNNGSGLVRVTRTAHGLITGAVIDISGSGTAAYNDAWKITRIDADNFDLDGSTYSTNPATKGTVAPRGGSSWTDAWKLFTARGSTTGYGTTDVIRVAKSPNPVSIGNATWTSRSSTVTLASAQTANIYLDGAWTAANSATATTTTTRKEGATASQITTAATTATSTKYAYYATGTLNLSSYDAITFWFRNNSSAIADANRYTIRLCSDTLGDTTVDTFAIPAIASTSQWVPLTLTRNGNGSLGSSIQSIALYTGTSSPGNSQQIFIDNVLGCTNAGLSLISLISKNSSGNTNLATSDTWHGLQSINGTTIILGSANSLSAGDANLKGYYTSGTTPETITTYARKTIPTTIKSSNTTIDFNMQTNNITVSGGWDTSTSTQDGETWYDSQNGYGYGINSTPGRNNWSISRVHFVRYQYAISNNSTTASGCNVSIIGINCFSIGTVAYNSSTISLVGNNNGYGITMTEPGSTSDEYNNTYTTYIQKNISNVSQISSQFFQNATINYMELANGVGMNIVTIVGNSYIDTYKANYIDNGLSSSAFASAYSTSLNFGKTLIKDATITNCTNLITDGAYNVFINKLTASGNTNLKYGANFVVNTLNATTTQIPGSVYPSTTSNIRYSQPSTFISAVNNNTDDNRSYWNFGNAISQTTTRHTASGIAWQINITNTAQKSSLPLYYPITQVVCNANSLVTVKAWVKKSHATDIAAGLYINAYSLPGISSNLTVSKSNDTNWEELTITFTPTAKGVVPVYLQAWWVANAASQSVYVDDITVTQA